MGIIFAIIAAILAALAVILTKSGLKGTDSNLAFALQAVLIFVITWGIVLAQGSMQQLSHFNRRTWLIIIASGICTTLSTIFSYRALKLADATLVSPIERSSLVIATILAAIFLKERMSWQVIVGVILITGGAVLIGVSKR